MSTVSEAKRALRQQLRAEALHHSTAEIAEGSRAICQRVQKQDIWRKANTVLLYWAVPGEPDLGDLVAAALRAGKSVALPRYDTVCGAYQVCGVTAPENQLVLGQFAIREPSPECPVIELKKLDLALVPGIGFTVNGWRLGRGKGHFDRMLAQVLGWKCGVGFDWQVVAEIPMEQHDIRLDGLATPSRWHMIREPL
jgi:5-formyltetrahydrofolate cyclo-ligase